MPNLSLKRVLQVAALLCLCVLVLLSGYLWRLDQMVTETFEGRRWSVPAIVYAQPVELYAGRTLSQPALLRELGRIGYAQDAALAHPGTYTTRGNSVAIHLRTARFVEGERAAKKITVLFANKRITNILTGNDPAASLVRLDPPVIGSFFPSHGEDRVILTPDQVPDLLREGLKAIEDKSFDQHHGFNLRGIARAILVNLREGKVSQGGSTITQQLVKSYYLDNRRTIVRKLRELAMAIILELRFSKTDLLNAYINEIFIGQAGVRAIHGFGLGAQFYFNRPLHELNPAQIATLITIIRGPSFYNPRRHVDRVVERRDRILKTFRSNNLITDAELAQALHTPLAVFQGKRRGGTYYPGFMDLVRTELAQRYAPEDLASQGLRIFTTLSPMLQDSVEDSIGSTLDSLEQQRQLATNSLQAAVVLTDTQTGEVLALSGARETGSDGFNRALKANRPIGSLVKPVVYLLALEQGATLASPVADEPLTLELPGDQTWSPNNFDEIAHGQVPLLRAMGDSLNLATVNLGLSLGVDRVAGRLRDLGGALVTNPYPSLLLGAEPRTPLQVAQLYATFASGGFSTANKSVIAVLDERGTTLSHHPFQLTQKIEPATAAALNQGLQIVMTHGTGKTSRLSQRGVAGKTGTSDDFRDSWFAGYDAQHLAVVWIGRDDNEPTGLTGATGAMRIWDALMLAKGTSPLIAHSTNPAWLMDYTTGYSITATCPLGNSVAVNLPSSVTLPNHPDCAFQPDDLRPGQAPRGNGLGDRLRRWLGAN